MKGCGNRYTEKKRAEYLRLYHELRAKGLTATNAAKNVGVPYITLRLWEKKEENKEEDDSGHKEVTTYVHRERLSPGKPAVVSIEEIDEPTYEDEETRTCIVTPEGYRVYGSVEDLVEVLRILSD